LKPYRFLTSVSLGLVAVSLSSAPAVADGTFLQIDLGSETQSMVFALGRGKLNYGLNLSDYADGTSAAGSVTYTFPLQDIAILKAGPSLGFQREDGSWSDPELGAKLSLERYEPTSFGAIYGLAEVNSVDNAWFVLAQMTLDKPDLGIELSRGGSDNYHETTFAVQKQVEDSPLRLRVGYKLSSEELFVGFSLNTF